MAKHAEMHPAGANHSSNYLDRVFESKSDVYHGSTAAGQRAFTADYGAAVKNPPAEADLHQSYQAPQYLEPMQALTFDPSTQVYASILPSAASSPGVHWPQAAGRSFVQTVLQPVDTPPKQPLFTLPASIPPTSEVTTQLGTATVAGGGGNHSSSTASVRSALRQLTSCRGQQRLRLAQSGLQLLQACHESEHEGLLLGQVFPVLLHLLSRRPAVTASLPLQALVLLQDSSGDSQGNKRDVQERDLGSTARALTFGASRGGAAPVPAAQALAAERWAREQAHAADAASAEWSTIQLLIDSLASLPAHVLAQRWQEQEQGVQEAAASLLRGGGCKGDTPPPDSSHPAPDMRMYTVYLAPNAAFRAVGWALGQCGPGGLQWLFGVCGGGRSLPTSAHRLLQGVMSVKSISCSAVAVLCTALLKHCAPVNGSLSQSGGGAERAKGVYSTRSAVVAAATMGMSHCGNMDDLLAPGAAQALGAAVAGSIGNAHTTGVEAGASTADAHWTRKLTAQASIMLGSAGLHAVCVAGASHRDDAVRVACVSATRRCLLYASAARLRSALAAAATVLIAPDDVAAQLGTQALGIAMSVDDTPNVQVLRAPGATRTQTSANQQSSTHLIQNNDCIPVLGGPTPFKLQQQRSSRPGVQTRAASTAASAPASPTATATSTTTAPAPFASPTGPTLGQAAAAAAGRPGQGSRRPVLSPGAVLRRQVSAAAAPPVGVGGASKGPSQGGTSSKGQWQHACGADGPIGALLGSGRLRSDNVSRVCIVIKASAAAAALADIAHALPETHQGGARTAHDAFPLTTGAVLVALTAALQDPSASVRACALQSAAGLRADGLACLVKATQRPAAQRYLNSVLQTALEHGEWGGVKLIAATAFKPERDNCQAEAKPFAEGTARWKAMLRGGRGGSNAAGISPKASALHCVAQAWAAMHGAPADSVLHSNALCSKRALFFHFCDAMAQAVPGDASRGSAAAQQARTQAVVGFDSMHVARGQALRAALTVSAGTQEYKDTVQGDEADTVAAHLTLALPSLRQLLPTGACKSAQLVAEAARAWGVVGGGQSAPSTAGAALAGGILQGVLAGTSDAYATVRHAAWSAVGAVPLSVAVACSGCLHSFMTAALQDGSPSARNAMQAAAASATLALGAIVPALWALCGPTPESEGDSDSSCADVLRPLHDLLAQQWADICRIIGPIDTNAPALVPGGSHGMAALAGTGVPGLAQLLRAASDPTRNAGERRQALAALGRVPVCSLVLGGCSGDLQASHEQLLLAAREGGVFTFPGAPAAALHALLQQHKQLHSTQACYPPGVRHHNSDASVVSWLQGALQPDTGGVAALASTSALLQVAEGALGSGNPNVTAAAVRVMTAPSTNTKHQGVLLLLHILRTGRSVPKQVAAAEALNSLRAPWLLRSLLSVAASANSEVALAVCSGLPACSASTTAAYILHKRSVKHALAVKAQAASLLSGSLSYQHQRSLQRAGKAAFVLPAPAAAWLHELLAILAMSGLALGSSAPAPLALQGAPRPLAQDAAALQAATLKAEVEAMLAQRRGGKGGSPASDTAIGATQEAVSSSEVSSGGGGDVHAPAAQEEPPAAATSSELQSGATADPFVASLMRLQASTSLEAEPNGNLPGVRVASSDDWELAGRSQLYSPSRAALHSGSFPVSTAHNLLRKGKPSGIPREQFARPRVQVGEPLSPGE